jgi:CO/xanthine dehydrogenase Mo-binding subunit
MIDIAQPDTSQVPNSGPTVASRTCMIVGKLVESAVLGVRDLLLESGDLSARYSPESFSRAVKAYVKKRRSLKHFARYEPPPGIHWDDETYSGDGYATYAWAAYVAQVAVDTVSGETRVEDFVAVQEVGRVVHPRLAAGQIEGGVAQAIGYALYEKVVWQEGRMANNRMTNYIMPTSCDLPTIRVHFEEVPYAHGPGGAKGIGELPMDGPAPAILAAVENAIGVAFDSIPLLPEVVLAALEKNR